MTLAARFRRFADIDAVSIDDVPVPVPGAGQVRLRVKAAGINPADWKLVHGLLPGREQVQLPSSLGFDVAGVIDEVGPGVVDLQVGQNVFGKAISGSFAELALAETDDLAVKPDAVAWEAAGSIGSAGGTAWTLLQRLEVVKGDTLLIHAASGGVGHLAAQLAVARGARVIGTASPSNDERLLGYGVEPVPHGEGWSSRVRELSPRGVDAVIDASGRDELEQSVELAGGPQRVLTIATFDLGGTGVQFHVGAAGGSEYRKILPLLVDGRVQVHVSRTYPLAETVEALRHSRSGHVSGKIVVLPD